MKTLYLSYDGLTDPLGQSQVLPYIVGLGKKGIEFTIISFEKSQNFQKEKETISKITEDYNVDWRPLKYTKRPPILSTIYDIYQLKKVVKAEARKDDVSLIHCRSYITALVGLWAKKKYEIPFVFDMRGFWADERVDGEIWDLTNKIHKKVYNYFKKKEKEYLVEAAYTISLTYAGKAEIESWGLSGQSPIQVIPCCTDEVHFNVSKQEDKRKDLDLLENDFVISYLGSIGTWYMLDEMLDFFKALISIKPNAKFLFITKDDEAFILDKCVKKEISRDAVIVKSSTRKDVPAYINTSDASIFFIKPMYSKKASSPTKMGEIMNMGIPVVCNAGVGDVDIVMNDVFPELLINTFDKVDYKKVAGELVNFHQKLDANKIVETSINYFSLKKGVESYFEVYKSVLKID